MFLQVSCFVFFVIFAATGLEVKETSSMYSCCKPALPFNRHCQNTWSLNQTVFAWASSQSKVCTPPCKLIADEVMMLGDCEAVNHMMVCTEGNEVTAEEWTYYFGKRCTDSLLGAGNKVHMDLLLLISAVLLVMSTG